MSVSLTAEPATAKEFKYIPQLDGLRAVAILAVFLVHSPLHLRGGWMGVDLFFVLSGFLITRILVSQRHKPIKQYFGSFYGRRARRILPAYLLALLVSTILFGAGWMRQWPYFLGFMNFALPTHEGLRVLWSLAVEEQFYLVWPFVILFVDRKYLPYVAMALIATAPVLRGIFTPLLQNRAHWPWFLYQSPSFNDPTDRLWPIYQLTPFRMECLAMGSLIGLVFRSYSAQIARVGLFWLIPTVLALGALGYMTRKPGFSLADYTAKAYVSVYELGLIACTGVFLWALSGKFVGVLTNSPVRWIGRLSYSFYLIHLTVFEFLDGKIHNGVLMSFGVAGVSLAYAGLSWRFIESPILGTKPSRTSVRAS